MASTNFLGIYPSTSHRDKYSNDFIRNLRSHIRGECSWTLLVVARWRGKTVCQCSLEYFLSFTLPVTLLRVPHIELHSTHIVVETSRSASWRTDRWPRLCNATPKWWMDDVNGLNYLRLASFNCLSSTPEKQSCLYCDGELKRWTVYISFVRCIWCFW